MLDVLRSLLDANAFLESDVFLDPADARERVRQACTAHAGLAHWVRIGDSEEGRPIDGVVLGWGPRSVSLIAGNHSDEPVGPDFLWRFALAVLERLDGVRAMLEEVRFCLVPHTNPDGAHENRIWRRAWPDFIAWLTHAVREPPGRDVEFGFPDLRRENAVVSGWLRDHAPFHVHGSLHGMSMAEGALLLIERHWSQRAPSFQERLRVVAAAEGVGLHDHDRKGDKGFQYLGPGFWTTPESVAMRAFFLAKGDPDTAALFRHNSLEYVRGLGGDPLCYVTEFPLFLVERNPGAPPRVPARYLALKELLPGLRARAFRGGRIDADLERFGIRPLPLDAALRMQLEVLGAALEQAMKASSRRGG